MKLPSLPQVVATVTSLFDLEQLPDALENAFPPDLLEFRLDHLRTAPTETAAALASSPLPILLTARRADEGGMGNLSFEERQGLLQNHRQSAEAVDLEIRSLEVEPWECLTDGEERPSLLVGSYHDFETTPDLDALRRVVERGMTAGVDLVKIATRLRDEADIDRLESLLVDPPIPMAVMGMGPLGPGSRVRLAQAGSLLNYGYTAEVSAPGQMQVNDLAERLRG